MYNLKDSDTTNVVSFNEKISEKVYRRSKGILNCFGKKCYIKLFLLVSPCTNVVHLFVISGLTDSLQKVEKLENNKVSLMIKYITFWEILY